MTLTRDTQLLSQGEYTAEQITAAFAHYGNDPGNIGSVICDNAQLIGLNSDFLACQIADESDWWQSDFAVNRNNPSGYGAVDNDPNQAYYFENPGHGVRVTVAHWGSYTLGNANPLHDEDSRARFIRPGWYGTVKTVGSVGAGVWASTPDYAQDIINRYAELVAFVGVPGDNRSKEGSNVKPDEQYSLPVRLDLANNAKSFADRPTNPDGTILAIVKHVTGGESLDGALEWNRNGHNQDGFDVQASAHFYMGKDGTTVQDVSLYNGAWANGVLNRPDLPPQFDKVIAEGRNPNDFTISIEHVGLPDDPDFPTPAQQTADARLTADLCDLYQIPVDTDHIIGHNRFDSVNRPNCPGPRWDFDADVRRVSYLLNGGEPNATPDKPIDPTGNGHAPNDPGSNPNDPGTNGGTTPPPGNGGTNGTGATVVRLGNNVVFCDIEYRGDGRGFSVKYPGTTDAGYRVGHGFADEYAGGTIGNDGLSRGYEQFGVPRCSEFAATIPGYDRLVTAQVFDHAVFVYDGEHITRMLTGVYAARWLATHGTILPADIIFP